jgi:hypothetical protein
MNLSALSIHMMLNITERWLGDPELVGTLSQSGPLGLGILDRIKKAHGPLAELENKRVAAEVTLRKLIDRAAELDALHDRKARSVHHHLQGLIEGADEPELVSEYRALESLLFPIGLRVVQLPYIEEGGAAVALDRAVGPEHRAKLAGIHVGEHTLLELFEAWLKAGHELGTAVTDRAELRAELARERVDAGTLDLKAGRGLWIQAIRGLLWALEADEALVPLAERVHAALEEAAATSLRRRGEGDVDTDEMSEPDGGDGVVAEVPLA